jgi:WD40 repeat protein
MLSRRPRGDEQKASVGDSSNSDQQSWDSLNGADSGLGDGIHDQPENEEPALSCDQLLSAYLPGALPYPHGYMNPGGVGTPDYRPGYAQPKTSSSSSSANGPVSISSAAWAAGKQRLFVGLSNGDVFFWPLSDHRSTGALRFVGQHRGSVTTVTIGIAGTACAGLVLTGSADRCIKLWDYQGRVGSQPTVCVQTLHGHGGTITGMARR